MRTFPWVSFCMSTYKRPDLLKEQLHGLQQQQFYNFEVVISDNDPEGSAEPVVKAFQDDRFRYYKNLENLGMVRSFNCSIERAQAEFIIMITDDDPVEPEMLSHLYQVVAAYPARPVYCACIRSHQEKDKIEVFTAADFVFELLHPGHTPNFLWSSVLLERKRALEIGGMPDFGSPHLADHAMLALCGAQKGGVFLNHLYSSLTSHQSNFSKKHFDLYLKGCQGFYEIITKNIDKELFIRKGENALLLHLKFWFLSNSFSLRKYYTYSRPDKQAIKEINAYSEKVLQLPFMNFLQLRYRVKKIIFYLKFPLIRLKLIS